MQSAIIPENEKERLNNLKSYSVLDTLPEEEYDEITYLASHICGTPISLISLIDENRQWFKSHHGLGVSETPREHAFCAHAINDPNNILIVPDSRIDERFHDNPLVTDNPFVIFYAGVPLVSPEGYSLGTLCIIDNEPRNLDQQQITALKLLANQLMKLLELRISLKNLNRSELALKKLNATKDKLFSIIGHDLRGPVGSFKSIIKLLLTHFDSTDPQMFKDALIVFQKTANTTYDLLENLLAWAKAQQSETIFVPQEVKLYEIVTSILELNTELIHSKNLIILNEVPEKMVVVADINMLKTILRNLISNAIKFTPNGKKIEITAVANDFEHVIKVIDNGVGINDEVFENLFKSTEISSTYGTDGEKGSGLGLLLCKEFVEQHEGKIWAESELNSGSSFIFSLPISSKLKINDN